LADSDNRLTTISKRSGVTAGQRSFREEQVIRGGEIDAHLEALIEQGTHDADVLLPTGMQHDLTATVAQRTTVP